MRVRIAKNGRVRMRAVLRFDVPAEVVWARMRDFERFTALDPVHDRIVLLATEPVAGARIRIEHRFAGCSVDRDGRILWWREEEGYAFSDLSRRGRRVGFPHATVFRVEPDGVGGCRWSIEVRGLWTARLVPRWAAWVWMSWILLHIVTSVRLNVLGASVGYRRVAMRTRGSPLESSSTRGPRSWLFWRARSSAWALVEAAISMARRAPLRR